jgi:EmrB/QacA subfamily drug resistance transporter
VSVTTSDSAVPNDPPVPIRERAYPLRWWILGVILAVELMDLLDSTIVNIALPSIRDDLSASLTQLQWIAGGYALTFAVGLVVAGRLGDLFGRKRLLLLGVTGFTVTSVLCAAAQSPVMLITLRLIQGLFAALMIPQGFGIVRKVFDDDEIGHAFSMFGPVIGGGAVLGPVVGGLLIDANLFGSGWRLIFLVNLPVGLAALIAGARLLPEARAHDRPGLDLGGALIVAAAVGLIAYPLIQGRELGWPAWSFVMIAAGLAMLVVFWLFERSRERAGSSPLVVTAVFARRAFTGGLGSILVFFGGMMGMMFTFSIYLQLGNGYSPVKAGLAFAPWAVGTAIGAVVGSRLLAPRLGRHTLHIGLATMAIGVGAMLAVVSGSAHEVSPFALAGPELVAGAGMGCVLSPLFTVILAGVDDNHLGSASGVLNAVQQLAGATGIALVGTLFFSVAAEHGFGVAFTHCLWVELAALAGCAILVFLLPMHPRDD